MTTLRYHLDLLAYALKSRGLTHVVISPGSRNAPIVAGFLRINGFSLLSAPDERAAAFMALGAADATGKPAAVICTSGTAVLNLYPAICEAYYRQVPLLAITADRPADLIDRWDGQTIHQDQIFEKHIRASFHFNGDLHDTAVTPDWLQTVTGAWDRACGPDRGPVHLNIPIEEPIYAGLDEPVSVEWPELPPVLHAETPPPAALPALPESGSVLVLAGQMPPDPALDRALSDLSASVPVLTDILSNIRGESFIHGTERPEIFTAAEAPELLLTTGMSVVSKPLKTWLRQHKPRRHIHVSAGGFVGDPFFTSPQVVTAEPADFFLALANVGVNVSPSYLQSWKSTAASSIPDAETNLAGLICSMTGEADHVHLANSLTIRMANRMTGPKSFMYGNRGTSGIDGTVSTAAGFAWAQPDARVICITGDIGFLYDKNALWCNPLPANLKIIIINNGGGMIFDKLKGPELLPALRPYIHTPHQLHAREVAAHYGVAYACCDEAQARDHISRFLEQPETAILEINTTTT